MSLWARIRNGLAPDPVSGLGGATEGDLQGFASDIIEGVAGGVVDLAGNHAKVTENSPAAMSVLIADGIVYVPNAAFSPFDSDTVKFWEVVISGQAAKVIAANSSGSARVDLICVKLDTTVVPDEFASNIATVVVVQGTPGAGVPATPANHYKLAEIAVSNGETAINTADITDRRAQVLINSDMVAAAGGDVAGPSSSVDNEIALFNSTTGKLIKRASGSGFVKATAGVISYLTNIVDVVITAALGSDVTAEGIKTTLVADENLVFGEVGYIKSDGEVAKADADAIATSSAIVMALASISTGNTGSFLLHGIARNDAWNWTVGGLVYLSTTAGALTQTAPSGTDDVIQILGVATHADRIYFNPQLVQVEHT